LIGGRNNLTGSQYAALTGDRRRPSRLIMESAAVELLQMDTVSRLGTVDLRASRYVQEALECVALTGHYFGARTEAEVLEVAREFVRGDHVDRRGRSATDEPIRVRRIAGSDCWQVVDGHHRLARAVVRGDLTAVAVADLGTTTTPIQDLAAQLAWTQGRRELYQPVEAPELERDWVLVRCCSDRLEMVMNFLGDLGLPGRGATSLDVGACYGWHVAALGAAGFDASGVELDPTAIELGEVAYGLPAGTVVRGEASQHLRDLRVPADVVTCFSVLHHFVLGAGSCSGEALLRLLDRSTGTVLFLDTGQAGEEWFRELLPAWTPDFIADWLRANSTFANVVPLGVDSDSVGSFTGNYGRTLFACTR
jgi:hypothetical protein